MGGLFRAPKPIVVPAPTPPPAPEPVSPAAADTSAEAARIEARQRARQGLSGTIATSARGVLAPLPLPVTRKSLLGE
jgi:hypothetical protein